MALPRYLLLHLHMTNDKIKGKVVRQEREKYEGSIMKELLQGVQKRVRLSQNNQLKLEMILVAALLFVGIFIRAYHFGMIPVGIHQDEAMAAVDAKALAEYGTDRFGMRYPVHFTAWESGQMSVLLSYLMVPFIKVLGFSLFSIRLPMLVVSCVGLAAMYIFARKMGGISLGCIALILGCICPWHYMQSRWSLDCNIFPHIFLLGTCFLLLGLKKKGLLYVSMVFFGLCSYCYGIANYSVPLFLLAAAVILFREKIVKVKEVIIAVAVYLIVALPEFLTMFINMFALESIETPWFTIPYFPKSIRKNDILFMDFSVEQLMQNIADTVMVICGKGDTTISSAIADFGPIYYFTVVFFVIGLVVAFSKWKRNESKEEKVAYGILLAWFFMGIWIGVMTNGIMIHRINVIFYSILFLAAVGIKWCIQKWKVLVLPIGALYGISALLFAYTYFRDWADMSRDFYYESYVDALYYAKNIECDYYYITPDPQWSGVEQVGEILTMFCHEIDAKYFQGETDIQDGQERFPYVERYSFEKVDEETVEGNKDKSVVYLVGSDEISFFSEEEYVWESFYDSYYVVSRKVE